MFGLLVLARFLLRKRINQAWELREEYLRRQMAGESELADIVVGMRIVLDIIDP